MKPTAPLPCPICGRKPKLHQFAVECLRPHENVEHYLSVTSNTNMRPVAQWNAYVRRVRARVLRSQENAK